MLLRSALFIDDDEFVLSALRRCLRREPFTAFFAEGPQEALEILASEPIDLVVSDHMMPDMDGLTLLGKVKTLYPEIIRVILTGASDLQVAVKAINEGEVYRFLTKPWDDLELKITLRNIFETIELRKQNQQLQCQVLCQQQLLKKLEAEHPGILTVRRDEHGCVVLDEELLDV